MYHAYFSQTFSEEEELIVLLILKNYLERCYIMLKLDEVYIKFILGCRMHNGKQTITD
jgi:hypothetical protein